MSAMEALEDLGLDPAEPLIAGMREERRRGEYFLLGQIHLLLRRGSGGGLAGAAGLDGRPGMKKGREPALGCRR
jgi:hypothetical protein